jgi:hypothetical protein
MPGVGRISKISIFKPNIWKIFSCHKLSSNFDLRYNKNWFIMGNREFAWGQACFACIALLWNLAVNFLN